MANLAPLVARLIADSSGFRNGLASAERDLASFTARARTQSREAQAAFRSVGAAWTSMTGVLAAVGISIGFGSIVREAGDFERQLNIIRGTSGATSGQMRELEGSIRRAGLEFRVGARSASQAAYELQKNGVSIRDINRGALTSAVTLAQALGGNFADSAQVAATAMQVFHLQASDLDEVIQGVTGTVLGGKFELEDYVTALQQGGGAARSAGLSLDDFNTALLLIQRNLGSSGSDTGTALRTFLARLTPQSQEAAIAMRNLGLNFYDASGSFIGLAAAAQLIHDKFEGLNQQSRNANFFQIFGIDAMRVAISLYNEGAAGVDRYRGEVGDAANATAIAHARTEGFSGAIAELSASFEDLGIAIGESGLLNVLSGLAHWAAGTVRNATAGLDALGGPGELGQRADDPAMLRLAEIGKRLNPPYGGWSVGDFAASTFSPRVANAHFALDAIRRLGPLGVMNELDRPDANGQPYWMTAYGRELYRMAMESARRTGSTDPRLFARGPVGVDSTPSAEMLAGLEGHRSQLPPLSQQAVTRAFQDRVEAAQMARAFDPNDPMRIGQVDLMRQLLKAGQIEHMKVEIGDFVADDQRLKSIAEDFSQSVGSTLRDAFVNNDWSNIGDTLAGQWRSALWDAFVGDAAQRFMTRLAHLLQASLSGVMSTASDAVPGRGLVGIIDRLLGGPGSTGGLSTKGFSVDALWGPATRGASVTAEWGPAIAATLVGGKNKGPGILSSIISGIGSFFGGFFADGGYLQPGQWGIAGENGPEPIFAGPGGLSVMPAPQGGGGITVNVNAVIDARGSDANAEARIRVAVEEAADKGAARALDLMARRSRSGSSF